MKKFLCSIALGTFLAFAGNLVLSQNPDPPPPGRGMGRAPMDPAAIAAHLARRLSLTSEQQAQVTGILTDQQAQHKALEDNQTITHQQFLAQSKALHEQSQARIAALLNDTQKAQFAEMGQHMHPGPGPKGEQPPSE